MINIQLLLSSYCLGKIPIGESSFSTDRDLSTAESERKLQFHSLVQMAQNRYS